MSKSAVMVFSKDTVNGYWKWGEYSHIATIYGIAFQKCLLIYFGIDFSSNVAWNMHINQLLDNGRIKKVN